MLFLKMYERGNKRLSVKVGCVADWTPLRSLLLTTLLLFQSVFVVVEREMVKQDEADIVKAVGAKSILEHARQTPHDFESQESAGGYI